MEAAAIIAGAAILCTGFVVWVILRVVETFGDYAVKQEKVVTLLMALHESQQMIAGQNEKMWREIQHAKSNGKAKSA